ncbi:MULTISPECIES: HAD-IA family hydrolase [Streptomyces]|uniref:HAD-IA family hydrolase n=1 Tax=Streptomyces lonegramiae TaxID=3075524 RepID=A0ABU2XAP2_9ACTN|nr:HAD-IA family hydrolase [Streptomyces sp. DSM 41529]MDT0542989.1 HAD-IA family hydrolase [Streptomyces sp. DSM 41529]
MEATTARNPARNLVIFDCDGVLVDSERLSARALHEMGTEYGFDLSPAEALAFIRGRKVAEWVAELGARRGRNLPEDFVRDFRDRAARLFTAELTPVPGVRDVVEGLTVPYCAASSAPRDKIRHTLGLTGLLPLFASRIYSAYEVGCWKPDPGLFLHAAADLGVAPHRCAVVEDSLVGVRAAVAAGMPVFGYAPPESGTADVLAAAGAVTFPAMSALPALLDSVTPRPPRPRTGPARSVSPVSTPAAARECAVRPLGPARP